MPNNNRAIGLNSQSSIHNPKSTDNLTWLITGGCGFIGTRLIDNLVNKGGHRKVVLDNLSVGTKEDLAAVCDIQEIHHSSSESQASTLSHQSFLIIGDACMAVSKNVDVIVHLPANKGVGPSVEDPRADIECNVVGVFNMLEAARQNNVKRFILSSSGAPMGECNPQIHEELAAHPVLPYGASKLAREGYCSAYFRSFGLETVDLRFGNVYGPGSGHKNSVVAKFIKHAMNGETLEIYDDGN
jgi:UDP-glucose 4-epimerase